jgi:hypothetical protein
MTQGRALIVWGCSLAVLVWNVTAVAQASGHAGGEQNRHE